MAPVNEKFLSFLWKYKLYDHDSLYLDGEKIDVVNPGEINIDSGPDFFNSKIKIGNTIWVGNIEIHVKSSDWNRHGHDTNPAFNNVILHITELIDIPVYTSIGQIVPTVKLLYDKSLLANYIQLLKQELWIPCANHLHNISDIIISSWLTKIGIERLEAHSNSFISNMTSTINDWEEVLYRQLARSFGFHVNALPFEALAKSVPFKILKKYRNDLFQLEALLFGQSGLLFNEHSNDKYFNKLKTEHDFLQKKHSLKPIEPHLWKFMRVRPGNFPSIRIAQFAAFIHLNPSFFSNILEAVNVQTLINLLKIEVSAYWKNHYTYENATRDISKPLGEESCKVIIINAIIPYYFMYGKINGLANFQDKALQFLETLGPEKNSIIDRWKQLGIVSKHAFDTQALIEQKNEYCDKKRCLDCGIGLKIISNKY